jgi:hypothetical protein
MTSTETEDSTFTITAEERQTICAQIGMGNILSISGGRVRPLADGIELPVSHGYRVRVRLTAVDDYTVQRVQVRGGVEYDHGTKDRIYCDQVGEVAYLAGMFRSFGKGEW